MCVKYIYWYLLHIIIYRYDFIKIIGIKKFKDTYNCVKNNISGRLESSYDNMSDTLIRVTILLRLIEITDHEEHLYPLYNYSCTQINRI